MRILTGHVIVVVLLAGAAHAQTATPPNPFSPPVAGQWVEGTWRPFRDLFCNQVQVRIDDLARSYVEMDVAMGKDPQRCDRGARSFALAGGALQSLGVMAERFEASSTSLNQVEYERFDFHDINQDDTAVEKAAAINCDTSSAEAHALLEARFAEVRKNLGDMPTVCGRDIDSNIASRRAHSGDVKVVPRPAPTPQTVNVTVGCSQAGTLPSLMALGVVLRRRRRSSR